MRKAQIDRLLLTAVAEAIGQPVPMIARPKRQSSRAQARKHMAIHFAGLKHDSHAHAHA